MGVGPTQHSWYCIQQSMGDCPSSLWHHCLGVLDGRCMLGVVCCGCHQPGRMVLSLGSQILPRRQHHAGG